VAPGPERGLERLALDADEAALAELAPVADVPARATIGRLGKCCCTTSTSLRLDASSSIASTRTSASWAPADSSRSRRVPSP
jgi:hypothetical protein